MPETRFPKHWLAWMNQSSVAVDWDQIAELENRVGAARAHTRIFPEQKLLYAAFEFTVPEKVQAVILGQDPYHGYDDKLQLAQAHGLSFSVRDGMKLPPSLRNIFKELSSDLSFEKPVHGNLEAWARQGVLLLNTVLSVNEAEAGSHRSWGWQALTEAVIQALALSAQPMAFVLWGNDAGKFEKWIDKEKHLVVRSAHPSPLSASRGFYGSRPFSKINTYLVEAGLPQIDWSLEEAGTPDAPMLWQN